MDILVQDKDIKRLISIIFLSSLITSIKNGENLDDLIESVASKGGTTEAGLNFLYKEKFNEIFLVQSMLVLKKELKRIIYGLNQIYLDHSKLKLPLLQHNLQRSL